MKRRGFTLIELSVVIVLIALFAATILPKLNILRESQQAAAFRTDLVRFFRDAREKAISNQRTVEVRMNGQSWQMSQVATDTGDGDVTEEDSLRSLSMPSGASMSEFRLNKEDVSADDFLIRCFPDGTVSDASMEMTQDEAIYVLRVNGATGRVSLRRGELADENEESWPAGELEKRVAG